MTNVSTTFVPDGLKYESMFSGLIFDAEKFLCDEVALRVKLFVYKQKFVNFRLDLFLRTISVRSMCHYLSLHSGHHNDAPGSREIISVVITAIVVDVSQKWKNDGDTKTVNG